jgi:tripartite-type tricarboxylate transporter receptor subunit TctC
MKSFSVFLTSLIIAGVAAVFPQPSQSQTTFPNKAVTFIVPFGVGGNFDTLARKLAARWEKEMGVPFAIKSLPGSGGRRGSIRIHKSKPDGYTIGFVHFVPFMADIHLRGKKPAVDYKQFKIIYKMSHSPNYLFVRKTGPYMSVKDLANAGKTIKFASTGIGAITWVEANATGALVGFPLNFVLGYKKLTNAALAVAKGDADAGIGGARHFRPVKDDLRPLMFFGKQRDPFYPNVPSAGELGYTKLTALGSPRIITAPPGTPESRLKVFRDAAIRAANDPAFKEWARTTGFYLRPQGPKAAWQALEDHTKVFTSIKPLIDKSTSKK